jgi:TolB-like protein/Tfp pilus assembly protein PilF
MGPLKSEQTPSKKARESPLKAFIAKLRKRHIIETFAGFIAGGWLFLEFVDRLLVAHYHFPDETIDLSFITILAALICTILWRWFRGTEKRPGNVKVEVLLVPLIVLAALALNLNIVLDMAGISGLRLLTGIIALCLGIAWIIFKSLQWAAIGQAAPAVKADLQRVQDDRDLGQIAVTTAAEAVRIRSLAVLPLANLSSDPEQEYFADGMTEEVITSLARFAELRVISRTSSMHFKGSKKTLPEIAEQLHVDGIVEGTVCRAGDRVRISAQLIHAPTDQHIWAENYERDLSDILALQSEVARAIAGEIQLRLTPQERARLSSTPHVDSRAYELYLKGRHEYAKMSADGFANGIEYLEKAIQNDPTYAPSYAALAECYWGIGNWGLSPAKVIMPKAKAAAAKALQLDANLAEAHASLAVIKWVYDWDWGGAEKDFKRAIELNPSSATVHYQQADLMLTIGRFDEGIAASIVAEALDPISARAGMTLGYAYFIAGQYDRSIAQYRKLLSQDPKYAFAYAHLSFVFALKGMTPEAIEAAESARRLLAPGKDLQVDLYVAAAYARCGKPDEILELIRVWERLATQRYVDIATFGEFFGLLGRLDEAFEYLSRSVEERSAHTPWLKAIGDNALFYPDKIRLDPRWQDLLRRVGFPP